MLQCPSCKHINKYGSKFCGRCGTPLSFPFDSSGRLLNDAILRQRYKVLSYIASGGMGNIYKALDMNFNNEVALKEMIDNFTDPQEKQFAIERFETEAKLLRNLKHPSIPAVIDYFSDFGRNYLVMDFVQGEDLRKIMQRNPKGLPEKTVIDYAIQLCDVLEYLHNQKPDPIIYRDMKPSNLILLSDGKLKLVDFGIARHFKAGTKGTMIGTPGYSPPEQYKGIAEPRSDIFALGVTLHYLLTGSDPEMEPPFTFHLRSIRKLNPSISTGMEAVVMKALGFNSATSHYTDINLRFKSAGEMKSALQNLLLPNYLTTYPPNQLTIQPSIYLSIYPSVQNVNIREITTFVGHTSTVTSLAFSFDGKILASGSEDSTIKIWSIENLEEITTLKGHSWWNFIYSVAFSPDGKMLASASGDNTIRLWNVSNWKEMMVLKGNSWLGSMYSVAFNLDSQIVASGDGDWRVKLWSTVDGHEIKTLSMHSGIVTSIAFSPDGKTLASGSNDKTIKLWSGGDGRKVMKAISLGHTKGIKSIAFNSDGQILASGSDDNTIKLWSVIDKTEITTLTGHTKGVKSVAFNSDGRILASGSDDATIKLWSVGDSKEIKTFARHTKGIKSVVFSPDGKILASGGKDNIIKLWLVSY